MAHNSYPAGTPTGVVPSLYVVLSTDWKTVIDQCYAAINGDAGGTWVPGVFITVGGAGFQFTGTGHSLAASARLNVESTAEIRLKNGALLKADGTSGDIRLEVTGGVATFTVQANALAVIAESANFDAYGAITLKDNGGAAGSGGNLIVEATGLITVQTGGLVALADGATFTLNGDMNVSSTGVTTWQNGSNLTSGATAFAQWSGEWWFTKTLKVTAACDFIIQGSTNWIQYETARPWSRGVSRVTPLSFAGASTGPADPDIWEETSDLTTAVCARTSDRTASGGKSLFRFDPPPVGGLLTEAKITSKGTKPGSIASTRPTYVIVSWKDSSSSGYTTHSSITTDAGSIATFGLTETETTITATGSTGDRTVVSGRSYGLLVTHPYEAINEQGARFYDAHLDGTATEQQV